MLVWIDLEASGLVATEHSLLEVASIVTDDQLREVDRFHRVVYWPGAEHLAHLEPDSPEEAFVEGAALMGIDRVVVEMHSKNGLWAESAKSAHGLADVDAQFTEFLARTATSVDAMSGQLTKAPIAGSSIGFDRAFMAVSLPRALEQLHYRTVDVTTLNELARRLWPRLHGRVPSKREIHRSMPDIEDSLALCRYYAEQIADGEASLR